MWFGSAIFMSAHSYQRSFMSLSSITNDELLLAVPSSKSLSTLGERAFQFAAPSLWNGLPKEIRQIQSLFSFKKQLKTFLFRAAYNVSS